MLENLRQSKIRLR